MRNLITTCVVFLAIFVLSGNANSYYLDSPHNESNSFGGVTFQCDSCHGVESDVSGPVWAWANEHDPNDLSNPDATTRNAVCYNCHGTSPADVIDALRNIDGPDVRLHSSPTGAWSTQCVDCHDPHFQGQLDWNLSDEFKLYVATGNFTSNPSPSALNTTITFSLRTSQAGFSDTSTWYAKGGPAGSPNADPTRAPDGSRGLILVPYIADPTETYEIIDVTGSTMTVKGIMGGNLSGLTFGVIYGQLLQSFMLDAHGTGFKNIKLFKPENSANDLGGLVDQTPGANPPVGLCQVCHDPAATIPVVNWLADGTGQSHNPTTPCWNCHGTHFEVIGDPLFHSTFIADDLIQGTACSSCHGAAYVTSPDGTHIARGCQTCHDAASPTPANPEINDIDPMVKEDNDTPLKNLLDAGYFGGVPGVRLTDAQGDNINDIPGPFTYITCNVCHVGNHQYYIDHPQVGNVTGFGTNCVNCHDQSGYDSDAHYIGTIHAAGGCGTCHVSPSGGGPLLDLSGGGILLPVGVNYEAINGGAGGSCVDCHAAYASDFAVSHETETHVELTFNGAADCVTCHTGNIALAVHAACTSCHTNTTNDGRLKGSAAGHTIGGSSSCIDCHGPEEASFEIGHTTETHVEITNTGSADCVSCHTGDIVTVVHIACISCHTDMTNDGSLKGSASGHIIGGSSSCIDCHGPEEASFATGHTTETHVELTIVGSADCACCHTGDIVSAVHNACTSCHTNLTNDGRLKGSAASHIIGIPSSCIDCHPQQEASFFTGHTTDTHVELNAVGSADCAGCHTGDIVTAVHNACTSCHTSEGCLINPVGPLHVIGSSSSCIDCHPAEEASFETGHVTETHVELTAVGSADCVTCHTGAIESAVHVACTSCHIDMTNDGRLKGSAVTHVIGTPSSCIDCHGPEEVHFGNGHVTETHVEVIAPPDSPIQSNDCDDCHTGNIIFDVPLGHNGDCNLCHTNVITDGRLKGNAAGHVIGIPSDCIDCHGINYFSDTAQHSSNSHSIAVDGDTSDGTLCSVCHTSDTGSWANIKVRHDQSSTNPDVCKVCHDSSRTSNVAGQYTSVQDVITSNAGSANIVSCLDCHTQPLMLDPIDHPQVGNVTGFGTNCVNCHDQTGIDADSHYISTIHAANGCGTCHVAPAGGGPLVDLSAGGIYLPVGLNYEAINGGAGGDCTVCHPAYSTGFSAGHETETHTELTAVGADDCAACHTGDIATAVHSGCGSCHTDLNTNGTLIGSASSHTVGTPSSCINCHTDEDSSFEIGHTTETHVELTAVGAADCVGCHTGAIESVVHAACTSCHTDLTNDGRLKGSASGHTIGGSSSCIDCHGPEEASFEIGHTTETHVELTAVGAADCVGCHTGAIESVVHAACTSCHTDITLDGTLKGSASAHIIGGSSSCVDCHTGFPSTFHHDSPLAAGNNCATTCHQNDNHTNMIQDGTTGTGRNCSECHTGTVATGQPPIDSNDGMVHDFCLTCHTFDANLRGVLVNFTGNRGVIGAGSLPDGGSIGGTNGGGQCTNCHTVAAASSWHHVTNFSAVGDCEQCHDDPREPRTAGDWDAAGPGDNGSLSGLNVPTQLACRECHASWGGGNLSITKFTRADYNTYANQDWTRQTIHTIPMTANRINNFGICFGCHDNDLSDTAPTVQVWHARPDQHDPGGGNNWSFPSQDWRRCEEENNLARFVAGRSSGTISTFNLFFYGYGGISPIDYTKTNPGGGSCNDDGQFNGSPLNFVTRNVPSVPGNNYTSGAVPVFPSLMPSDGSPPTDDVVSVQSATWDGTTLSVNASNDTGCGYLTVFPPGTGGIWSGNCATGVGIYTANLGTYPGTIDVISSAPGNNLDVIGFPVQIGTPPPPPMWLNPCFLPDATEGVPYNESLVGCVNNPGGDPITFSKTGGPAWLNVASNGDLGGIPGAGDVGISSFSIRLTTTGGFDTANMNIMVNSSSPPPQFLQGSYTAPDVVEGPYSTSVHLPAVDPEGNPITYSRNGGTCGVWASVATNGIISGTFSAASEPPGVCTVIVRATAIGGFDHTTVNINNNIVVETWNFASFSTDTYSVDENAGNAQISICMSFSAIGVDCVDYSTSDGTAVSGADYTPTSGTLCWNDGESGCKTVNIPITDDAFIENDETVLLSLSLTNPSGDVFLDTPSSAVLTILDSISNSTLVRYRTDAGSGTYGGIPVTFTDTSGGCLDMTTGDVGILYDVGTSYPGSQSACNANGPRFNTTLGTGVEATWIMTTAYAEDTLINASLGGNVGGWFRNRSTNWTAHFEIGYVLGGTFTLIGSPADQVIHTEDVFNFDLTGISGTAPAGSHLALRFSEVGDTADGNRIYLGDFDDPEGSLRLMITETPVNQPPQFGQTTYTAADATENFAYSTTVHLPATDPESDLITYSRNGGTCGAWATVVGGIIRGTPFVGDAGTCTVEVLATATGGSDSTTVTISVNGASGVICQTNSNCQIPGEYCEKAPGNCFGSGICEPMPGGCSTLYAPVCSCSGQDFSNDCMAAVAGENVNFSGTCF